MAIIKELLRAEPNGSISFGNYELESKSKLDGFEHKGDKYKVKTCKEITRLECNDLFVYESVPGTAVESFERDEDHIEFLVSGYEDADITLGLIEKTDYEVIVDGKSEGAQNTGAGGKLTVSVPLDEGVIINVQIKKL